jgi:DNA-binding protein H-NS
MTKTYAQLKKQIDALTQEAEALKKQERDGVIARIKEAIGVYELSAADLGLVAPRGKPGPKAARQPAGRKARKTARGGAASAVRFRDAEGNTWGGRGPRPAWLRAALEAGKSLKDFAV